MRLLVQLVLSILLASPACAAIARVQKADAYPGNSVTLNGTTAGNFLVVSASWADTTSDPTVSDTASNTWNPLPVLRGPAGQAPTSIKLFYAMNIAGGNTTITLSSSPADVGIHAVEYSGVATGTSVDVTNTAVAAAGSTTPTSGSFTPTAGDLIYVIFADEGTAQSTINAGSGYALITATGNHVDGSEDNLSATAGAQTASFTLGTTTYSWALYVATFKPASSNALNCGKLNDTNVYTPPTYDTFTPPAKGQSYIDPVFGCTITRITDAAANGWVAAAHFYSLETPFNADDSYVFVFNGFTGGSPTIVDLSGNTVVPTSNMPGFNSAVGLVWDLTNPKVFYYTSGQQLIKGTISGTSPNATVASTSLATFSQYASVVIPDDIDLSSDGLHLWLADCYQNCTGYIFLVTLNAGNGAATSASQSTVLSGITHHGMTIVPNNGVFIDGLLYNSDGTLFNGTGIPDGNGTSAHSDWGLDSSGKIVSASIWAQGTANNGCPSNFGWSLLDLTTNSIRLCLNDGIQNVGNSSHVSMRDTNAKYWVVHSVDDSGTCPDSIPPNPNPSSPYYCYYITTNMSGWGLYTGEIIIWDGLGNSVRLAHHRSRSDETFWAQTRAAISRDGRYIAFDSNFNQSGKGANYIDVYVIGPLY
jgi:hypothetical protein